MPFKFYYNYFCSEEQWFYLWQSLNPAEIEGYKWKEGTGSGKLTYVALAKYAYDQGRINGESDVDKVIEPTEE